MSIANEDGAEDVLGGLNAAVNEMHCIDTYHTVCASLNDITRTMAFADSNDVENVKFTSLGLDYDQL
ncbi:6018_t:CDS:2, partial [Paraglomus occultum]